MRKLLPGLFIVLFTLTANAQDKDWSLGIHYPFSLGDTFPSSNQGLIGANLSYRFANMGAGEDRLGVSLDASWFRTTTIEDSDPIQETDFRDFFLQANVFYEAPLTENKKLKFIGGLGWAIQYASRDPAFFNEEGNIEGSATNTGPVISAGLSYDFARRWYISAESDFMFMFGDSPNRTLVLTKIGVGFRF